MTKAAIASGCGVIVLGLVAVGVGFEVFDKDGHRRANSRSPRQSAAEERQAASDETGEKGGVTGPEASRGFLYGRVTTESGVAYEGRLRWGDGAEAFWGDYFNGAKSENTWASLVPPERLPTESDPLKIFGFEVSRRQRPVDLGRLFMARFGDISRIEGRGNDVLVTLKSATVFVLDRLEASDFDDGVRVWDATRGVVDLQTGEIRTIELLPSAELVSVPVRLHGTVRTKHGAFTGFLQWDRVSGVGSDELQGRTADGQQSLRFDTLRSIARHSPTSLLVTLTDGRELVLFDTHDVGNDSRGIYVDDRRYGRVLVSLRAFEGLDFTSTDSGPSYSDFPAGGPLEGSVTTRTGQRLAGRLVFDLDESETTETLDAPAHGVDYTIPFGQIASLVLPERELDHKAPDGAGRLRHRPAPNGADGAPALVTLEGGEVLSLERSGDLGDRNLGMLIFSDGSERPAYVAWSEVVRVELE